MTTEKIVLNEKQDKWLRLHFKNTKNEEIAKKLGISETSMHRLARERGLKKTKQFVRKCQTEASAKAKESHIRNGTYPPKGYIIPESGRVRFKPGLTPLERFGPKVEKERIRKAAESRRKTYKSEKARVAFGLPQRTHLRIGTQSRKRICLKYYLRKKGYIVDDEKRIVYYGENTRRGNRVENSDQPWYKFKPLE